MKACCSSHNKLCISAVRLLLTSTARCTHSTKQIWERKNHHSIILYSSISSNSIDFEVWLDYNFQHELCRANCDSTMSHRKIWTKLFRFRRKIINYIVLSCVLRRCVCVCVHARSTDGIHINHGFLYVVQNSNWLCGPRIMRVLDMMA